MAVLAIRQGRQLPIGVNATGDAGDASPAIFDQPGTKRLISPLMFVAFLASLIHIILLYSIEKWKLIRNLLSKLLPNFTLYIFPCHRLFSISRFLNQTSEYSDYSTFVKIGQ